MKNKKFKKINQLFRTPIEVTLACSGGPDSMAILDFLRQGRKKIQVAHFNHGTDQSDEAEDVVKFYCKQYDIPVVRDVIKRDKLTGESYEQYWREERLRFLHSFECIVLTAHNLDDVAEWWLFTSMRGNPKIMPYKNKNICRPFLLTEKEALCDWANNRDIPYVRDPSNQDFRFARSRIRHSIMRDVLEINPGFKKVISKKIKQSYSGRENAN